MDAEQTTVEETALNETVAATLERWNVPGMAVGVLHNGTVTTEGFGVASLETKQPVRADTLFQIGSITKVFTATLVMRLVEEGLLDLDTPVSQYLPDLELADESALKTITMRHLLSHTSGLEGDRFDDYGIGDDALTKAVAEFNTLRQLTAPGELWTYCNSGFNLAGAVIERLLDTTFEAAVRERIFEPLKMERSFFFAHEAIVYPVAVGHSQVNPGEPKHEVARLYPLPRCVNAAGGIISTVGDLLRFAQAHLENGTLEGTTILTHESVQAMQVPQTEAANFVDNYAIGWAVRTIDGVKVIGHGGSTNGFQAQLTIVPEKNFAIAMLTNGSRGMAVNNDIEKWALKKHFGLDVPEPEIIELSEDQIDRFTGVYVQPHARLTLTRKDGGLEIAWVAKSPLTDEEKELPPITMKPISDREFKVTEGDMKGMRVDFILSDDGGVRFIRMGGRLAEPQSE
jgi:CubicO group peptidase (beta-lactamase class C family)